MDAIRGEMADAARPSARHGEAADASAEGARPTSASASASASKRRRSSKRRRRSRETAASEAESKTDAAAVGAAMIDLTRSDGASAEASDATGAADASADAQWSCPACTFLNDRIRRYCEVCETRNPAFSDENAAKEWTCVACTAMNAPSARSCTICGTINPNGVFSGGLSLAPRLYTRQFLHSSEDDSSDDDDDDDDDDGDEDGERGNASDDQEGSADDDASDEDGFRMCPVCDAEVPAGAARCLDCCAPCFFPRHRLKRARHEVATRAAKRRAKKSGSKRHVKNAYGVSSVVLKNLAKEPTNHKLLDTLRTLTHTLAMMDASSGSEWGEIGQDGPSFLLHGFGAASMSKREKDPELLTVLSKVFRDERSEFPAEVRLFAVQSINYIMKMDRHLFPRSVAVATVRLMLSVVLRWGTSTAEQQSDTVVILEECVNGLSGLCGSESAMLQELTKRSSVDGLLSCLHRLVDSSTDAVHISIITTVLELLQKCCAQLKWSPKSASEHMGEDGEHTSMDVELAKRVIDLLRHLVNHGQVDLHMQAIKCLGLVFHRVPRRPSSVFAELVTRDVLAEIISLIVRTSGDEPDDSRQSAASLLISLVEKDPSSATLCLQEMLYVPMLRGIPSILDTASPALGNQLLKLVSSLMRLGHSLCDFPSSEDADERSNYRDRVLRMDPNPDPHVRESMLIDFVRADCIPAVGAILSDGVGLGVSKQKGAKSVIEAPLHVAAQYASLPMVRYLVKHGADSRQSSSSGTPLHLASQIGRCDVVSFLLECGASPTDKDMSGRTVMECVKAVDGEYASTPVKKLLELHQRALRGHEDSDFSDEDYNGRQWFLSRGNEGDEEDDDDTEEIDWDEEDSFYVEDDEIEDDDVDASDDDISEEQHARRPSMAESESSGRGRKRRRESSADRADRSDLRANGLGTDAPQTRSIDVQRTEAANVQQAPISLDVFSSFCNETLRCLLTILREHDLKSVERVLLFTIAFALEMVPQPRVNEMKEADLNLLLDTASRLLQDHSANAQQNVVNLSSAQAGAASGGTSASLKGALTSYFLSIRILHAISRKSTVESPVFSQIERRGICDQVDRFHEVCRGMMKERKVTAGHHLQEDNQTIVLGRGQALVESLRSNMIESGVLHLHKLKNLARRVGELTSSSDDTLCDMVVRDVADLFLQPNFITTHEFQQSGLLSALAMALLPGVEGTETFRRKLIDEFVNHPSALKNFVPRLQSIFTQEENLRVRTFNFGKGRELYPLTKQLSTVCSDMSGNRLSGKPGATEKVLQIAPLTHFQSFERSIFKCLPPSDAKLISLYVNLIGHSVKKVIDGKWKKFFVCGFDPKRCFHLVRPVGDLDDELVEVVLHDSQFRLCEAITVHSNVSVNLDLFGDQRNTDSQDNKKRKRGGKKRTRFVSNGEAIEDLTSHDHVGIEVQNTTEINAGSLYNAWYAGAIEGDDEAWIASRTHSMLHGRSAMELGNTYSVKLLNGAVLNSVPAELIRPRFDTPQVGSVVELDGLLGEVCRVDEMNDTFDVRLGGDQERNGVRRHRIQYPASVPSKPDSIHAMSLSRLFPASDRSMLVGSVGDAVWISPLDESACSDIHVAGRICAFPSGLEAINGPSTVFVEVFPGQHATPVKMRVPQSRVLNLTRSRRKFDSSRLLSALANGTSSSGGSARLSDVQRRERSDFAISRLRQLIAQTSRGDLDESRLGLGDSGVNVDAVTEDRNWGWSNRIPTSRKTKKHQMEEQRRSGNAWKGLKVSSGDQWTCTRLPRVRVVMGFERRELLEPAKDDIFAIDDTLHQIAKTKDCTWQLTEVDPISGRHMLTPSARESLSSVFSSFDPAKAPLSRSSPSSAKKRKKRKLLNSAEATTLASVGSRANWNIDDFLAFMKSVLEGEQFDDPEGTLVDNCVLFSRFASPDSRRQLLALDGFLELMADLCKTNSKAQHVADWLRSCGYSPRGTTTDTKIGPVASKEANDSGENASTPSTSSPLRSFPPDQNMLKCIHDVQQAHLHDANEDTGVPFPPWKYKYYLLCDVEVTWIRSSPTTTTETLSSSIDVALSSTSGPPAPTMLQAIHLLQWLMEAAPPAVLADEFWINTRLANKLETQLDDVLSVCSGIYPSWCDTLVATCRFLFPRELREKLFRATAFGSTRSLHWFRNQLNMEESSSSDAAMGDGMYNHEISVSPIPKERVKVQRDTILESAEAVMKMHGKRKAILDIVFVGEKGYGSGVTAAFYSAAAQALQVANIDLGDPMRLWVAGEEASSGFSAGNAAQDEVIRHPNGLFPFPHRTATSALIERFRMMGRLAGKALMDDRLLPLPLSTQFIKLVQGERVSVNELERVFLHHGRTLHAMSQAARQLQTSTDRTREVQIDGMPVQDWLDAVSFTFIDPLSQQPLHDGGQYEPVTIDRLAAYVDEVLSFWLQDGIQSQVAAFRDGISEVIPIAKLKLLHVSELLAMLCGDADIEWDADSLFKTLKLAHGYSKDSAPVRYLVDALVQLSLSERRSFLLYATGCPNLPAGGFAALRPPFEVVRRVVDTDNVDLALPFARTCTNTLHLPAYSSESILLERLRYAIANSRGVIDRD